MPPEEGDLVAIEPNEELLARLFSEPVVEVLGPKLWRAAVQVGHRLSPFAWCRGVSSGNVDIRYRRAESHHEADRRHRAKPRIT